MVETIEKVLGIFQRFSQKEDDVIRVNFKAEEVNAYATYGYLEMEYGCIGNHEVKIDLNGVEFYSATYEVSQSLADQSEKNTTVSVVFAGSWGKELKISASFNPEQAKAVMSALMETLNEKGGLTKMLFGRFYTALEKNGLVSDMKREGGIVTITVLDKFTHMIAKEYVFVMGELVLVRIRGLISNRIIKMIRPRQSYLERLVNKAQEDFMKGCISNEQAEKLIDPGFLKEYPGEFLDKPKEEVIVYVEEKDKRKLCDLLTENGYEFTVSSENAEE